MSRAPALPASHVRTDGRLLVSYPKSGRTWVRYALDTAGIALTFSHAGAATHPGQVGRRCPDLPAALRPLPLIFLHRNPIDTVVSMFYQVLHKDLRPWRGRWLRSAPRLLGSGAGMPPRDIDAFVRHPIWGSTRSAGSTGSGSTIWPGATTA